MMVCVCLSAVSVRVESECVHTDTVCAHRHSVCTHTYMYIHILAVLPWYSLTNKHVFHISFIILILYGNFLRDESSIIYKGGKVETVF